MSSRAEKLRKAWDATALRRWREDHPEARHRVPVPAHIQKHLNPNPGGCSCDKCFRQYTSKRDGHTCFCGGVIA